VQPAKACGFYETEADYRAMMFRASLPGMKSMRPFLYTMNHLYDDPLDTDLQQNDRYRNCAEWQAACDPSVTIEDIYQIQYNTDGNLFVKVYKDNSWEENFANNTLVKFLIKKNNKDLLDYLLFAKKMELTEVGGASRFEEWNSRLIYGDYSFYEEPEELTGTSIRKEKVKLRELAWENLKKATTVFLQQRYAFQVCRLQYQLSSVNPEIATADVFGKYFGNIQPDNLMSIWAGLFQAMTISPTQNDRYRYLIRVFANSDEKKFRCVQVFDDLYDADSLSRSERSMATVMVSVKNPGRALDQIHEAYTLDPANPFLPFLVMREINKLEDWLITPLFYGKYSITNSDPFQCAYLNPWVEEYKKEHPEEENDDEMGEKLQLENQIADQAYLLQLKSLLKELRSQSKGETKDFYSIALAHLSLLEENTGDARKYLSMVSPNANVSIQLQKNLETIWLAIKTQDINSSAFKKIFLQNIADLERISTPNYDSRQMLYTLTLSLANEYLKKDNRLYGNLMRLKSDLYHYESWYSEYRVGDSYTTLEYFDNNATIQDMDKLLALLEKKNQTAFEQYLCDQPLSSINAYKDLKGTIAFRNNDLPLAYAVFASMPADYWQSDHFSFASYLNEDPFIPKGLRANIYRKYDYAFNKAGFVKELMDLQKQTIENQTHRSDAYRRLGDAYFNTSYWGNAWMMTRYGASITDLYYSKTECLPLWMRNYMTADIARTYYEKALHAAENDEQRAYASVMLYYIYDCCCGFRNRKQDKNLALQYANKFMQYDETQAYRMYECPGIQIFIKNNH
jgi:hypothetical protein